MMMNILNENTQQNVFPEENRKKNFDCNGCKTPDKKIPIVIFQEICSKDMRHRNLNENNACPWGGE